jgi:preprotein translocase subunit SecG
MSNIQTVLLIVHTLIALAIIALVLLQRGKGAEAGAAFGAGASGTVFGARGSTNFFSRTTAILATLFFASSLALAFMSSQGPAEGPRSLIETAAPVEDVADDTTPNTTTSDGDIPELPAMDSTEENVTADELPAFEDTAESDSPTEPKP